MNFIINGQARSVDGIGPDARLEDLVTALGLKQDRIAVEQNGAIVARSSWPSTSIAEGDRFEIVHFVGGGCFESP